MFASVTRSARGQPRPAPCLSVPIVVRGAWRPLAACSSEGLRDHRAGAERLGRGRAPVWGRLDGTEGWRAAEDQPLLLTAEHFRTFLLASVGRGPLLGPPVPSGPARPQPPLQESGCRRDTFAQYANRSAGAWAGERSAVALRPQGKRAPWAVLRVHGRFVSLPGVTERLCCLPQVISAVSRLSLHNVAQNKGIR